ncbi:protein-L-isoaspartate (D-aspartate) O-methyltransferase [Deferribacter desulfuricans SSM1]|uniref:Protein-L-isoaspartate O-methyltransferase n=1 Tax=Deferribacter desulfuricans (strain DSM 14783 / JCM 11476 / NBRC 101012 / SSM1) TaxID=639282 RepID=D3PAZ5_DEFDS|nr:protein-L-isoaspartate(D-aspartate) O-methyltransferase [Deferribacter desulfuricans]BAI79768.1 protein-L-isoaspartate (D-aspartate) O-methyltransferase [Deferribacter desulfuricans SSM1]
MRIPEYFLKEIIAPACNNERIVEAFKKVPRHLFIDDALIKLAYKDDALPIGYGQTISKPSTVAKMTAILDPQPNDKVLEIGTGSGFQAAILSKLVSEVYTVERIPALYRRATTIIRKLYIHNVKFKIDNGKVGWEEYAPYDKIIVTAGAELLPEELLNQLKDGGRLVIPINNTLKLYIKESNKLIKKNISECKFVKFVF